MSAAQQQAPSSAETWRVKFLGIRAGAEESDTIVIKNGLPRGEALSLQNDINEAGLRGMPTGWFARNGMFFNLGHYAFWAIIAEPEDAA